MPFKIFELSGVGPVKIVKSKSARHLKLSINSKNEARVSIPAYVPYATGLRFAASKKTWLVEHLSARPQNIYQDGARIGKSYRLKFEASNKLNKVVQRGSEIIAYGDPAKLQVELEKQAEKALRADAEKLLPMRLKELGQRYGYSYKDVKIRKLVSRWGSCSSEKRITLSFHLIQLPWELIDYVLLHELNHTVNMNHGPKFWADMEVLVPQARAKRKLLQQYRSAVMPLTS